jgi:hypothetical protein
MRVMWEVVFSELLQKWTVRYSETPRNWILVLNDAGNIETFRFRKNAIRSAARTCRHNWTRFGEKSELRVRNKTNGRYSQETRTYGHDPRGNG